MAYYVEWSYLGTETINKNESSPNNGTYTKCGQLKHQRDDLHTLKTTFTSSSEEFRASN